MVGAGRTLSTRGPRLGFGPVHSSRAASASSGGAKIVGRYGLQFHRPRPVSWTSGSNARAGVIPRRRGPHSTSLASPMCGAIEEGGECRPTDGGRGPLCPRAGCRDGMVSAQPASSVPGARPSVADDPGLCAYYGIAGNSRWIRW
jgi:hypothetical protein